MRKYSWFTVAVLFEGKEVDERVKGGGKYTSQKTYIRSEYENIDKKGTVHTSHIYCMYIHVPNEVPLVEQYHEKETNIFSCLLSY